MHSLSDSMWSILASFLILSVLGLAAAVGVVSVSTSNASARRIPLASLFHGERASWRRGLAKSTVANSGIAVTPVKAASASKTVSRTSSSTPFQVFVQTILDARRHLTAAAVARSTSIFLMYPADVFKTRLQMKQADAFRLTGLFNGVTGSLLGQVPYGVLTFGSYEMYKSFLLDRWPGVPPIFKYAMAAVFGDLTGSGWLCPSEVIKQKVQAGMFPTTSAAISSIWQQKGVIGFYEGYLGGIARDVPFRVAQLTTYELTKNLYLRLKQRRHSQLSSSPTRRGKTIKSSVDSNESEQLSPGEAAFCGAVAGSFSAAVTAPLDRIKTLLMTNSAAYGGTVLSCAAKIWRDDGLRGLTTGVVPRVVYIAPSVAIFFVAYEMTQQKLQHWKTPERKQQ